MCTVYTIHITPEVELFISGAARALPPPPLPLQFAAQPGQFLSNTQDCPPPPLPPNKALFQADEAFLLIYIYIYAALTCLYSAF